MDLGEKLGKRRLYMCPACNGQVIRPLHLQNPKPCDRCLHPLDGVPYVIADAQHELRKILNAARRPKEG